jgi:hypothetical protein
MLLSLSQQAVWRLEKASLPGATLPAIDIANSDRTLEETEDFKQNTLLETKSLNISDGFLFIFS